MLVKSSDGNIHFSDVTIFHSFFSCFILQARLNSARSGTSQFIPLGYKPEGKRVSLIFSLRRIDKEEISQSQHRHWKITIIQCTLYDILSLFSTISSPIPSFIMLERIVVLISSYYYRNKSNSKIHFSLPYKHVANYFTPGFIISFRVFLY